MNTLPSSQVGQLARWILENVSGEPSQSQGAIDTAIRLLSRLAQLEEALLKYGQHGPRCPIWATQTRGTCTCGLDAALEGRGEPEIPSRPPIIQGDAAVTSVEGRDE